MKGAVILNIEHLRYVLEVDRAGSISQAAENLYMKQPNLSKAIKELETALNITIFVRTSKGARLTAKGREFLHYAQSILQQYEEMEALGRDNDSNVQSLRVSVPRASYIVDAFTTFLNQLNMEKPIQIDFSETNALRAIRHVAGGQSRLGIIRCKTQYLNYFSSLLEENGLTCQSLLESEYLILLAHTHPLRKKEILDIQELLPYIEIVHGDTTMPYISGSMTETERASTPGNKKIQVYERGSQFDILTRVSGAYMWVSPMPEDLLRRNGLVQKHCCQSSNFTDLLIYPQKHKFHAQEQNFLDCLKKTIREILAGRLYCHI